MSDFSPERRLFLKHAGEAIVGGAALIALPQWAFAKSPESLESVSDMLSAILEFHNGSQEEIKKLGAAPIGETFVQHHFVKYQAGQTIADSFQKDAKYVADTLAVYKTQSDGVKKGRELCIKYIENIGHYVGSIEINPDSRVLGSEAQTMTRSLWEKKQALRKKFGLR